MNVIFVLHDNNIEKLDNLKEKLNKSRSQLIRDMIDFFHTNLDKYEHGFFVAEGE